MSAAARRVLLTGATGFVGRHLHPALAQAGWQVRATSRDPTRAAAERGGEWVRLDVEEPASLAPALEGCDALIYLVHAMGAEAEDYEAAERRAALAVRDAAAHAGVERIVYLGGVAPAGEPSKHLRSRLMTGALLRAGSVPTFELRAAMILGQGSASWQICRDLASRLPVMLLPRWVETRSCPVAIDDVVAALTRALELPLSEAGCYDLPGPEVLSAREILARIARLRGRSPLGIGVPLLSPKLSSHWLRLVTRADYAVAAELVQGLSADLLPNQRLFWEHLPEHRRTRFDVAALRALLDDEPSLGGQLVEGLSALITRRSG